MTDQPEALRVAAFSVVDPVTIASTFIPGITLRDYFAAKAMQAQLQTLDEYPDEHWRDGVAMDSYRMADAMLKAREKVK